MILTGYKIKGIGYLKLVGHKHYRLSFQRSADTLFEYMFTNMPVNCTQRVIQQIDVSAYNFSICLIFGILCCLKIEIFLYLSA